MIYIGNDKYKLLANNANMVLKSPDHYDSEIEYVESTGTQWIDCKVLPTPDTKIQFKFINLQATGNVIIGSNEQGDTQDYRFFNYNNGAYFDVPGGSGTGNRLISSNKIYPNTEYELELGNYYVLNLKTNTIIVQRNTKYNTYCNDTIGLNGKSSNLSKNRFYYVKIYENNSLVFDAIPVRVDQIGYMYDKISGKLFGNQGTGEFILGPDINT